MTEGLAGTEEEIPGMEGPLDLSDADTTAFDAIDAGNYNLEIVTGTWEKTSGEGKMPAGHPMLNVQFRVLDEPYADSNRMLFHRFVLPKPGYDEAKTKRMKGMFVRFLTTIGYDEEELKSGTARFSLDELEGKTCVATVAKRQYPPNSDPPEYVNDIKGFKPAGSQTGATQTAGLV